MKDGVIFRLFFECNHEEFSDELRDEAMCTVCDKMMKVIDAESSVDSLHRAILEFETI